LPENRVKSYLFPFLHIPIFYYKTTIQAIKMDLKELESGVNPSVHWYYQSKKVPLFKYFKKLHATQGKKINVIDFGSGSGFFAYELLEAFPQAIDRVFLVDIGYSEAEMAATRGEQVEKVHFIPEGIEDSVVVMMDVLEHIEDDYAILEDIKRRLGKNAHYFITVPAFMSLWSSHDVYLEHYRRYTLPSLRKLLDAKSCQVDSHYYIYGALFPVAWIVRKIKNLVKKDEEIPTSSDMGTVPAPINALLKQANIFEMNFRKINKLFGITAVSEGVIKR
jgi:SAM-dependent methyltransferase